MKMTVKYLVEGTATGLGDVKMRIFLGSDATFRCSLDPLLKVARIACVQHTIRDLEFEPCITV